MEFQHMRNQPDYRKFGSDECATRHYMKRLTRTFYKYALDIYQTRRTIDRA